LRVSRSPFCRNDRLLPAKRHRKERIRAAAAQSSVMIEDNLISWAFGEFAVVLALDLVLDLGEMILVPGAI